MSTNLTRTITDGCTAAAHVAYALSDVATVYPITPIASMGDTAARWALAGRKNVFGNPMKIMEMESELGAAGATHGALSAGVPATTFTASQGLLLMIPNMYKIAGELLPGVFHVGCRSLASHALSIFGDHQDVMACRATGFAFLMSNNVQEAADMALVAHLSALDGSLPVVHMFDGWRTGNEMSTVELPDYERIASITPMDAVRRFRSRGMNPATPNIRGTAQNPDVYFQNREACNRYYDAFADIVEAQMHKVEAITGRHYELYEYEGAPDADRVIVIMGSAAEVVAETVAYLNGRQGTKLGVLKVRLFRPFDATRLLKALPATTKSIAVMDRTKEPGAQGEPLLLDVATALQLAGRNIKVIGGRYGLGSKDFSPAMVKAIFDVMESSKPGRRFTVGINDDVTHLSLPTGEAFSTAPETQQTFQFYGMGSDGTVGATKQAAKILSDLTGDYVQAFFDYSAKKSGGYTVSSLRLDSVPIRSEYAIEKTDYLGVNRESYLRLFDLSESLKPGGIMVVNTARTPEQLCEYMPEKLRKALIANKTRLYAVNGAGIAAKHSLGVRINTIMESVFLKLCGVVDYGRSIQQLKDIVSKQYIHEGENVVANNLAAIDDAADSIVAVTVTESVAEPTTNSARPTPPEFVAKIAEPCLHRQGDKLPVSLLTADGFCPPGETAWEKRTVALNIPAWDQTKCIQCTLCSLVCSHATIRPVLLTAEEAAGAPFPTIAAKGPGEMSQLRWRIQTYPEDCTGCGTCAAICPVDALSMQPLATQIDAQKQNLDYCQTKVSAKDSPLPRFDVRGSQLQKPLFEFSGACGGCGETPYVKLLTQLFGERLVIANATGCSSVWGADYPSMPYCTNAKGHGPAWGNSLFEDNAEYGLGIALGLKRRREATAQRLDALLTGAHAGLASAIADWKAGKPGAAEALRPMLPQGFDDDMLEKPSVWAMGGDGWAYDIGYAGLDHVIANNEDINILVLDTECYANTGGQMSKATPLGAIAKYAPEGKRTVRKDLGRMAMTYGHVYVATISLAANPAQAIKVLQEAEAYPGPSLIIAYSPCINHGIRPDMSHSSLEMRRAVKAGYWPLWHYNPLAETPLTVDSAAPDGSLPDFLDGENRYADLPRIAPAVAEDLRAKLAARLKTVYNSL